MIKARAKSGLVAGSEVETDGHSDMLVQSMLEADIMQLEPYEDLLGNVIPEWYTETRWDGYNWHISWLDIIDTESSDG